ncbi:hypothetical protein CYMTET_4825 [Cymbomonas tetramitiformis]|uniref:Uncharacterized protein n=1 Tax=Cymbomonas tetramitiformis TaxID=36881 RepID=A0AAE0LJP5_9CHLO|nr:hypothetical protein CYMTET_4825 [Cymbomonas tetramitiformis]
MACHVAYSLFAHADDSPHKSANINKEITTATADLDNWMDAAVKCLLDLENGQSSALYVPACFPREHQSVQGPEDLTSTLQVQVLAAAGVSPDTLVPRLVTQIGPCRQFHCLGARQAASAISWIRKHPNYGYQLLGDAELNEKLPSEIPEWFSSTAGAASNSSAWLALKHSGERSDIARYALLRKHGGIYADLDTIALQSLEPLLTQNASLTIGLESDFRDAQNAREWVYARPRSFGIHIFAITKDNPILTKTLSLALENVRFPQVVYARVRLHGTGFPSHLETLFKTGPDVFARSLASTTASIQNVRILGIDEFSAPFPLTDGDKRRSRKFRTLQHQSSLGGVQYAVHTNLGSWLKNDAQTRPSSFDHIRQGETLLDGQWIAGSVSAIGQNAAAHFLECPNSLLSTPKNTSEALPSGPDPGLTVTDPSYVVIKSGRIVLGIGDGPDVGEEIWHSPAPETAVAAGETTVLVMNQTGNLQLYAMMAPLLPGDDDLSGSTTSSARRLLWEMEYTRPPLSAMLEARDAHAAGLSPAQHFDDKVLYATFFPKCGKIVVMSRLLEKIMVFLHTTARSMIRQKPWSGVGLTSHQNHSTAAFVASPQALTRRGEAAISGIQQDAGNSDSQLYAPAMVPPQVSNKLSAPSRGILIPAGNLKQLRTASFLIAHLRKLGCKLPISVAFSLCDTKSDMRAFERLLRGVHDVSWLNISGHHDMLSLHCGLLDEQANGNANNISPCGYAIKPYALAASPFVQTLLLDADNSPLIDPTFLFDDELFQKHGNLFWPDYHAGWVPGELRVALGLSPAQSEFDTESGQIMVDKRYVSEALAALVCLTQHATTLYRIKGVHGDKDTYRLAFEMTSTPFTQVKVPPRGAWSSLCEHRGLNDSTRQSSSSIHGGGTSPTSWRTEASQSRRYLQEDLVCEDSCYGESCDYWHDNGYNCTELEQNYGCTCDYCSKCYGGMIIGVISGACYTSSDGRCLYSPNYPSNYGNGEECVAWVQESGILNAITFHTEETYDFLYVDSLAYHGSDGPTDVPVNSSTILRFTSDESLWSYGFEVCIEPVSVRFLRAFRCFFLLLVGFLWAPFLRCFFLLVLEQLAALCVFHLH